MTTLPAPGLIAAQVVHIAFVMQIGWLVSKVDVGRALFALVHLVSDYIRNRHALGVRRQADVGQDADEDELGVFGGGGFVGHG